MWHNFSPLSENTRFFIVYKCSNCFFDNWKEIPKMATFAALLPIIAWMFLRLLYPTVANPTWGGNLIRIRFNLLLLISEQKLLLSTDMSRIFQNSKLPVNCNQFLQKSIKLRVATQRLKPRAALLPMILLWMDKNAEFMQKLLFTILHRAECNFKHFWRTSDKRRLICLQKCINGRNWA